MPSEPSNVVARLAHAAPPVMAVLAVLFPITMTAMAFPGVGTASLTLCIAVVIVEHVIVFATLRHRRMLCTICAAMTPLDGAAAVAKWNGDLRRFHTRRLWLVSLFLPIAGPISVLLFGLPPIVIQLSLGAMLAMVAIGFRAWNRHTVLEPWCPYCRKYRRWEDEGEPEPSPDPSPSGHVQV